MHAPARRFTRILAIALPTLISIALVAGFLGRWHPALDAFSHFRAHLAVLLALSGLPGLFIGYWKEAAASLVLGLAALSTTAVDLPVPGPGSVAADPLPSDTAIYRLLQLNLKFDHPEPETVLSIIGRTQPDIITLEEVSAMWREKLAAIASNYPYMHRCPRRIAVLSRRPFAPGFEPYCRGDGRMGVARINLGGGEIDVAVLHLPWPWPFRQMQLIDEIRPTLGALAPDAILAGDFNAAGWSEAVKRIVAAGRLRHTPPAGPTFLPEQLPGGALRRIVGLPIDRVLVKGGVRVHSVRSGEAGSDHAFVLVEFSLEKPEPPQESITASLTPRP